MNDKPILFSTPMVQAILAGRKTQTRRVIKPQPAYGCYYAMNENGDKALHLIADGTSEKYCVPINGNTTDHRLPCPYGKIGDLLWVRETFTEQASACAICYKTDFPMHWDAKNTEHGCEVNIYESDVKWKPSIFMPRSASRITLEITSIKVERLQDISEEDCWKEGIEQIMYDFDDISQIEMAKRIGCCIEDGKPLYAQLWESINSKGSWDLNPWVWVIEFKPHLINVDDYIEQKKTR